MNPTEGVIGEAWSLYKAHWRHLLTLSVVVYAVAALIGLLLGAVLNEWAAAILTPFVSLIALYWLTGALVKAVDDIRDGRADLSIRETFASALPRLAAVTVGSILAVLGIALGLILLIVPGLVLMTWWVVLIPVIVLENRSAGEAFTRSRELVRGHAWSVFGLILLAILLLIGAGLVINLALLPLADWLREFVSSFVSGTLTAPFIALMWTVLYFRLRDAKTAAAEPLPPAAA